MASRKTLLIGMAATVAAGLVVRARSRQAEHDNPPAGRFVEVDGVRLHYVERGSGPPLILLHGNSSNFLDFLISDLVPMAAQRYRVLVFDRPGYGYSDPLPGRVCRPEEQARLIHGALRRIKVDEALVLGHSWGTLVAVAMALEFPQFVRGLMLEAGFLYPERRMDMALLAQAASPVAGELLRRTFLPIAARAAWPLALHLLFAPGPVPKHFRRFPPWMVLRPAQLRTAAIELAQTNRHAGQLSRHYGDLRVPLTILSGRGDRIVAPGKHSARLHAALPHSRYRVFEDVGHMAHHQRPREVMDAIDELSRREA